MLWLLVIIKTWKAAAVCWQQTTKYNLILFKSKNKHIHTHCRNTRTPNADIVGEHTVYYKVYPLNLEHVRAWKTKAAVNFSVKIVVNLQRQLQIQDKNNRQEVIKSPIFIWLNFIITHLQIVHRELRRVKKVELNKITYNDHTSLSCCSILFFSNVIFFLSVTLDSVSLLKVTLKEC